MCIWLAIVVWLVLAAAIAVEIHVAPQRNDW
jgi:hypothetical protein